MVDEAGKTISGFCSTTANKGARGEPSAREVQDAMERATQVDTFSGDRRGEVQAAMRDVGYGGSNWT